ncbi:hypothetical protein [Clostridium cylindrosporum]|uniref:Tfp pilus assembly protein ATPase PilM-like protein n=1 Tax=Clostridium cylindrosporum DSM 605 TaxID=1121307 RepID=A0A0J8D603_CLOCY|nr:hypothetical protein [Clostridium cylindrosporum]KMT21287.1 Tfp pilus assembly protein ATPase PilM-like protein [Clostridium cylindrosporum DSM 605]
MGNKLCIDFSSNKIRFARGRYRKGFIIDSFFSVSLDGESLINSSYSEEVLGETIRNKLKDKKIKDTGVTFIISAMPNMLVREINVPLAKKSDTYRMVKQEAAAHFPINMDNYVIDYRVVDNYVEDKIKKQKLIGIAVPKFLIERLIGIANAADLRLDKIDIEANTLSKLLYEYQKQQGVISEKPSIICAIQDTYITMVVVKKGVIQMSKTNSYESVDTTLNQPALNEVAPTNEFDNANNSYTSASEQVKVEVINDVSDSIVRYINFYTSKQREEIETVYILGKVGDQLDIAGGIRERIEVQTKNIDDLKVVISNKDYKDKDAYKYKNVFAGLLK